MKGLGMMASRVANLRIETECEEYVEARGVFMNYPG